MTEIFFDIETYSPNEKPRLDNEVIAMAYKIEKNHTQKFIQLLQSYMPQYKQYKEELNKQPLRYPKLEL